MYQLFYNTINYIFKNPKLLTTALTHSSYAHEKGLRSTDDNERLEFLGDAVLELTVSELLYEKFPDYTEGQLTKLRASLVCESNLAKLANKIHLESLLRLGNGEETSGGRKREALISDAFEAVLGALFLDGGLDCIRKLITRFMYIEMNLLKEQYKLSDYKTYLQEKLQKTTKKSVSYVIIDENGPDHDKTFTANVLFNDEILGTGSGKSKKEAEQAAALSAIKKFHFLS